MKTKLTPVPTDYRHITKTPGVCGGKACIDGTRIRVMDIVVADGMGLRPKEILEHYSSRPLILAEVHAALGYYHDHKDEIDACFEADRAAEAAYEIKRAEYLARRSAG